MTLPNFFILSGGRSGSTSLHHYLGQHPQIFMCPIKEPRYFAYGGPEGAAATEVYPVTSLRDYEALFARANGEDAIGDASPRYLTHPGAARRIHDRVPGAKLIVILRNPVERAWAGYLGAVDNGRETRPFDDIVHEELDRDPDEVHSGWLPYLPSGLYRRNLQRYLDVFDRAQMRFFLFEDLKGGAAQVCRGVFAHLGVDEDFRPDTGVRHNPTGIPRSRIVHRLTGKNAVTVALKRHLPAFIRGPAYRLAMGWRSRNLDKPPLSSELRARLTDYYRVDTTALGDLLGRDLSTWLEDKAG